MKTQQVNLGIDIGRVIMAPVIGGKSDTSFLSGGINQAMATAPSPGAMQGIATLVNQFGGRVWLVSKAGPNTEHKTRLWLEHHEFYQQTGVKPTHVRFCRQREEKAIHCRELHITHFIDDRLDVLGHLVQCVGKRYLFGEQIKKQILPANITHVLSWPKTVEQILLDLKLDGHYEHRTF